MKIDKKYIVDIKGKDFITYNGLLNQAHLEGVKEIRVVEMHVDWKEKSAYCIVSAEMKNGIFQGVGSGTQENCGNMVKGHFVEMAQTRAKARALRDALNIDMVAAEEMTEHIADKPKTKEAKPVSDMSPICSKCNAEITEKIAKYSQGMWGKNFCYNCQKIIKEGEEKGD